MPTENSDLILKYAEKYWDAGNTITTLIVAAAFGIYVLLAQYPGIRAITAEYWRLILLISFIGNLGLGVLLWRVSHNEQLLLHQITNDELILEPIRSAFHMRLAILITNFAMYATVIFLVAFYHSKKQPIGPTAASNFAAASIAKPPSA